jgi:hypothetical protein
VFELNAPDDGNVLGPAYPPQTYKHDHRHCTSVSAYKSLGTLMNVPIQSNPAPSQAASLSPFTRSPVESRTRVDTRLDKQMPREMASCPNVWKMAPPTDCSSLVCPVRD